MALLQKDLHHNSKKKLKLHSWYKYSTVYKTMNAKGANVAVIIKYIVERKGVEKMTFSSKKEADAYDKMLDSADQLAAFLAQSSVTLDEVQLEELGLYLASNKEVVQSLFKGNDYETQDKEPQD
ncbi:hypothetical protein PCNPT3_05150 [Psychromonas sp. CNPT3]|uniref:YebG family protein n=1 Tax=Psychromonas sp. CNPT3 TaxID=314282 RepID=UPI00006E48C9|nr:hypothetical protein PCNPT3_05150 [Psychromonas sp. CNPT3]